MCLAPGGLTAFRAGPSPEGTESAGAEMVAETWTLVERTEDLQPAQEEIGWIMTAT